MMIGHHPATEPVRRDDFSGQPFVGYVAGYGEKIRIYALNVRCTARKWPHETEKAPIQTICERQTEPGWPFRAKNQWTETQGGRGWSDSMEMGQQAWSFHAAFDLVFRPNFPDEMSNDR